MRKFVTLEHADAVFGGNRSVMFCHDGVNHVIHLMPACEIFFRVGTNRLADIIVNVAVAKMTESKRPRAGNKLFHGGVGLCKKCRHGGNRHRYVMLDRTAFGLLRGLLRRAERESTHALLGRIFLDEKNQVAPLRRGDLPGLAAEKFYPIQVKQKDKVGRPDIDAFEAVLMREGCEKGFFVSFDYSADAEREADAFFRRTGKSIVLFTVTDILNEHLARKLA